jgi:hypothetical protein
MTWWNDLFTIILLVCPLVALLTGIIAGFVSQNWGLGILTGATTIVLPLLMFEVTIQLLDYAPIYALIGLLGSAIGWGAAKLYTRNKNLVEDYPLSDATIFPDRSS